MGLRCRARLALVEARICASPAAVLLIEAPGSRQFAYRWRSVANRSVISITGCSCVSYHDRPIADEHRPPVTTWSADREQVYKHHMLAVSDNNLSSPSMWVIRPAPSARLKTQPEL